METAIVRFPTRGPLLTLGSWFGAGSLVQAFQAKGAARPVNQALLFEKAGKDTELAEGQGILLHHLWVKVMKDVCSASGSISPGNNKVATQRNSRRAEFAMFARQRRGASLGKLVPSNLQADSSCVPLKTQLAFHLRKVCNRSSLAAATTCHCLWEVSLSDFSLPR